MLLIHFINCMLFAWLLLRFISCVQRRMAMIGLTFIWIGELSIIFGGNVRLLSEIAVVYLTIGWITALLMIYTTRSYRKRAVNFPNKG
ncbi:MAG: hypothetical protein KAX55_00260 [Propionivibrio sp.]|nr:hypothetical protein [Propionivibrio sp.]